MNILSPAPWLGTLISSVAAAAILIGVNLVHPLPERMNIYLIVYALVLLVAVYAGLWIKQRHRQAS